MAASLRYLAWTVETDMKHIRSQPVWGVTTPVRGLLVAKSGPELAVDGDRPFTCELAAGCKPDRGGPVAPAQRHPRQHHGSHRDDEQRGQSAVDCRRRRVHCCVVLPVTRQHEVATVARSVGGTEALRGLSFGFGARTARQPRCSDWVLMRQEIPHTAAVRHAVALVGQVKCKPR